MEIDESERNSFVETVWRKYCRSSPVEDNRTVLGSSSRRLQFFKIFWYSTTKWLKKVFTSSPDVRKAVISRIEV